MPTPYGNSIRNEDMPAPDTRVKYGNGMFGPAMFHYAPDCTDPHTIAADHGFEVYFESMFNSSHVYSEILGDWYEKGELESVLVAWLPIAPGKDWKLSGMHDTEDGPMAIFLRKKPE